MPVNHSHIKQKIVGVHLLNDFSGSPLVFSQSISALIAKGYNVDLYTSKKPGEGFLSNIKGVNYHLVDYNWSSNKLLTLVKLLWSQLIIFLKLLRYWRQPVIIYINTVLPFGAALAGVLMRKRVVYHLHETSIKPPLLKHFLFAICNASAAKVMYVSQFLKDSQPLNKPQSVVIANALSEKFVHVAQSYHKPEHSVFNVLMLSSLKLYKGVNEFLVLARALPALHFQLVLNASQQAVDAFFESDDLPDNLQLFSTQKNVHPFYEKADLVLNLSHPDKWQETFGMTALEGMCYGLPVIVPPVGGIAELVENGFNGYQVDARDMDVLVQKVKKISDDRELYVNLSVHALEVASRYSMTAFEDAVEKAILQ